MEITSCNPSPNEQSLNPSMLLRTKLNYKDFEIPISVNGYLQIEGDSKILAPINEFSSNNPQNGKVEYEFEVLLNKMSLEHIQKYRDNPSKKNLEFRIKLFIKTYNSKNSQEELDKGGFEKINTTDTHYVFPIDGYNWITNYLPKFGYGNYMIVELPLPEFNKIDNDWDDYIKSGIDIINIMRDYLYKCEWNNVMIESRQFYETFKFFDEPLKNKFKDLIQKNYINDEGFDNLNKAITNLFEYSSKFIHKKDKSGKLMKGAIAYKEDAFFTYTLCLTIMNFLLCRLRNS